MDDTAIETVLAWQRASNAADRERLLALSAEDIAIAGPRGTTHGSAELLAWLARSGVQLRTLRLFARGSRVVVEQAGRWPDPTTGLPGEERRFATAFEVAGGRVVRLTRYDDLAAALAASDPTRADAWYHPPDRRERGEGDDGTDDRGGQQRYRFPGADERSADDGGVSDDHLPRG